MSLCKVSPVRNNRRPRDRRTWNHYPGLALRTIWGLWCWLTPATELSPSIPFHPCLRETLTVSLAISGTRLGGEPDQINTYVCPCLVTGSESLSLPGHHFLSNANMDSILCCSPYYNPCTLELSADAYGELLAPS